MKATASTASGNTFDHSGLDRLLHQYVNDEGKVDYEGLSHERSALNAYLASLGSATPKTFSSDQERLAFWINAYNGFTLANVLDSVYGKATGVKNVAGFFSEKRQRVGGEELTLDDIESRGRALGDPRIHFAVVCASASCPKLQRFAYTAPELELQLNLAARGFLADTFRGARMDPEHNRIYLSSIFKWYAGDFTGSTAGMGQWFARAKAVASGRDLLGFVNRYAPEDFSRFVERKKPSIEYLDYDWTLNAQKPASQSASGSR